MPTTINERGSGSRATAPDVFVVRPARVEEAGALAVIAKAAVYQGRLGAFGLAFNRLLIASFIRSRYGLCVVAERDGVILGYGAGVTDTVAFHREFVRRWGLQAALLIAPRLFNPRNLHTLIQAYRYLPAAPDDDPKAELLAMNVTSHYRRSGVATKIFFTLMASYAGLGIRSVKLGHIPVTLTSAVRFWESLGTRFVRTEELYRGGFVNVYVFDIPRE